VWSRPGFDCVVPGAAKPGVVGRYGEGWKVRVSAPPERGAANDAVVELLARTLSVRARDIRLVSGHGSRDKIVEMAGVPPIETEARLAPAERKDA
jgi:uncharacterized protein YggU (UPF0235/DUF167 family)